MKHLVPTLSAIAIMGMAPAFGASIADDLSIKPKAQIQLRAQFGASGTNTAGDDFNLYNGAQGDTEAARFSVRRARFGAEAKNNTGWFAVFQLRAGERADAGARSTYVSAIATTTTTAGNVTAVTPTNTELTSNKTRTAELYYANVSKTWKQEGFDIEVHGGLDKPFNNESTISSSRSLLPMDRANAHFTEYRDVGIGAKSFIADMVRVGFDIQNGSTTLSPDANSDAAGLFTSFRVEFSPGKDFMPERKQESWAGAEGHHILIGFDYQSDADKINSVSGGLGNSTANDQKQTVTTIGPDILYHFNGLSALADLRMRTTKGENSLSTAAAPFGFSDPSKPRVDEIKGQVWTIQAGYAIPLEAGFAIEPAIRFSKVDLNKDDDTEGPNPFNQGEYRAGQSGSEFTIGVNAYWNGHANKTQLAYTSWVGEEGFNNPATGNGPTNNLGTAVPADKAKASIITLQHQVTF